jgi:PleD family two-component response regulator
MPDVLYVEHSLTSQGLMRKFLKDLCDVVVARTVAAAKTLLAQKSFDLVITDFLFPAGDSLEFIKGLRKAEATRHVPILVVSASMDRVVLSRVLRAGANDGVSKPINVVAFRALVQRILEKPFVREIENRVSRVCCFQWSLDDRYFEFCPELQLTVSGASKGEVTQRMDAALREAVATARSDLGATSHETVVTHIVSH